MYRFYLVIVCLLLASASLFSFNELDTSPVSYKGRFRPSDAAARLWLEEIHHTDRFEDISAHELLWKMHFSGHEPWDDAPLFWVDNASLKSILGFPSDRVHFSYNELKYAILEDRKSNLRLMRVLATYQFLKSYRDSLNRSRSEKLELSSLSPGLWVMFQNRDVVVASVPKNPPWHNLERGMILSENVREDAVRFEKMHKKVAEEALRLMILINQFQQSDGILRMLPSKKGNGEWLPLNVFKLRTHDANSGNFTLFPDDLFRRLRGTYLKLEAAVLEDNGNEVRSLSSELANLFHEGYSSLAGSEYMEANGKALSYPTEYMLVAEWFYYHYPLASATMLLYAAALGLFLFAYLAKKNHANLWGKRFLMLAFSFHTAMLVLRCYILQRPPVSNMFETVIYVPWIAITIGFVFYLSFRRLLPLVASAITALTLLIILELTNLSKNLENVQPVLDSQYWLIIHVLLVVGSYGAFILSGIIGHIYLLRTIYGIGPSDKSQVFIGKCILQSMYIGLAMLIPGTLLGGVWAAESWGRFWDWDPKESWAFISICTYLICVHSFRFGRIGFFGLAVGAVIGLQVISFTWYGVNYILGTGLHSYGFGSGGEIYYYLFLLAESAFLIISKKRQRNFQAPKI